MDRAKQSIETIALLLCYKIKYPETFFLLRGNHECSALNRIYGFYDECKRRYSIKLWRVFGDCFNCMPVGDSEHLKFVCLHLGAVRRTEGVNLRRRRGVFVGDSRWGERSDSFVYAGGSHSRRQDPGHARWPQPRTRVARPDRQNRAADRGP